jgi:aspartate racemase
MPALRLGRTGGSRGLTMMDNVIERVSHVGILAGTSEGAALCYRILCREANEVMGSSVHPEITLHALPLRLYLDAINRDDWWRVAGFLSHSIAKLVRAGADIIVCPNNTLHQAFDLVESPVPWLHIAKPVAQEIEQHGWHRIGILGTQIVMEGSIYSRELALRDIEVVIPKRSDRIRIQNIIRAELIMGLFTVESRVFLQKVVAEMAEEGAEAVILGCTEMPLLLSEEQSALPLLDSTRLLAKAALDYGRQFRSEHSGKDRGRQSTFSQGRQLYGVS